MNQEPFFSSLIEVNIFREKSKYLVSSLKNFFRRSKGLGLGVYPKAPYWKIVKGDQSGGLAWALGGSPYSLIKNKKV